ncbi:AraC family transcriptional regulator [Chryseobacterium sp. G0162]|uniref:AraC family transcriptional regulator n=1 Tax=Chryseobacterium sp. G0162 TaxID=2487063 RepID=UPI0013DE2303|nr:helix-turn-helix domain-containing protein [Chryseobacterium sp. G0162]
MNERNIPIQRIREVQERLKIYHDIIFCQSKGSYYWYNPIRHDFLSLILFESAEGKHIIEGKAYLIQGKLLHLVFPGQIHYWNCESQHEICQLFISENIFERMERLMPFPIFMYKKKPVIDLDDEDFNRFMHEFKDIRDELQIPSPVMSEIIYSKMKIIVRNIAKEVQKNTEYLNVYESHPVLFDFMNLLNKNFRQERTKKYYADQLRINANYLNILCKKYLGRTAIEIIHNQTIEKIKYKLMMTADPLKDIAFDFSFQNYGHFSGFVKKHTGITPKKFRELYGIPVEKRSNQQ